MSRVRRRQALGRKALKKITFKEAFAGKGVKNIVDAKTDAA
jgi:hypothetical protein